MTEEEWLSTSDVGELLNYLREERIRTTRRPAFVASFADTGRLRPLLLEMQPAFEAYVRWARDSGPNPCAEFPWYHQSQLLGPLDTWDVRDCVRRLVARAGTDSSWDYVNGLSVAEALNLARVYVYQEFDVEAREWFHRQAERLRDIVGNPFRPVAFDPAWRTDTAVSLARGMYESRDFGAMPILADALQDAGCEDEQVLKHCREPGPHVRGCWVCDLVLGKV